VEKYQENSVIQNNLKLKDGIQKEIEMFKLQTICLFLGDLLGEKFNNKLHLKLKKKKKI